MLISVGKKFFLLSIRDNFCSGELLVLLLFLNIMKVCGFDGIFKKVAYFWGQETSEGFKFEDCNSSIHKIDLKTWTDIPERIFEPTKKTLKLQNLKNQIFILLQDDQISIRDIVTLVLQFQKISKQIKDQKFHQKVQGKKPIHEMKYNR